MSTDNSVDIFTVVFRRGTVVFDRQITAENIAKAAKKAERMTVGDGEFPGWSVYSITRGAGA
jgi:hypothetical protein